VHVAAVRRGRSLHAVARLSSTLTHSQSSLGARGLLRTGCLDRPRGLRLFSSAWDYSKIRPTAPLKHPTSHVSAHAAGKGFEGVPSAASVPRVQTTRGVDETDWGAVIDEYERGHGVDAKHSSHTHTHTHTHNQPARGGKRATRPSTPRMQSLSEADWEAAVDEYEREHGAGADRRKFNQTLATKRPSAAERKRQLQVRPSTVLPLIQIECGYGVCVFINKFTCARVCVCVCVYRPASSRP
jgi:hypothetical protein